MNSCVDHNTAKLNHTILSVFTAYCYTFHLKKKLLEHLEFLIYKFWLFCFFYWIFLNCDFKILSFLNYIVFCYLPFSDFINYSFHFGMDSFVLHIFNLEERKTNLLVLLYIVWLKFLRQRTYCTLLLVPFFFFFLY